MAKQQTSETGIKIKDAAVGQGVFTMVERGNKCYIHYNLPQGFVLFAIREDDVLAVEINNYLADVLETEHGKATRDALVQFALDHADSQPEQTEQQ